LDAGVACTGCPFDIYGFLRDANGTFTYFQVNGSTTAGRGITDSGVITGYVDTLAGKKGFVVRLMAKGPSFQALSILDAELLAYPGATDTLPEAIDNSGRIVGNWTDPAGNVHGFIATPH